MRIQLNQESSGGGSAAPEVNEQNPQKVSHAPPPATPAAPAAPPAAATVIAATITEETELLRVQLESERAARKKVEMDHASVSDEFQRYKDATEARREVPVQVKRGTIRAGMFR